jgi:hypothetical protein
MKDPADIDKKIACIRVLKLVTICPNKTPKGVKTENNNINLINSLKSVPLALSANPRFRATCHLLIITQTVT